MKAHARRIAFLVAALVGAGCAHLPVPSGAPSRQQLVGTWFGDAAMAGDADNRGDNLLVRNADGSFVTYFRLCKGRKTLDYIVETGRWSYADGVETATTLSVNGRKVPAADEYFVERYRVSATRGDTLTITSLKNHEVFDEVRADSPGFRVPPDACMDVRKPQI
jgi:hypothetical protein